MFEGLQLNKANLARFGAGPDAVLDIAHGGTGADNALEAAANLGVPADLEILADLTAAVFAEAPGMALTRAHSTPGDDGGGTWLKRPGDRSAVVAADPLNAFWAPPDSDSSGASGAWERVYLGGPWIQWFGVTPPTGDGSIDMLTATLSYRVASGDQDFVLSDAGIAVASNSGVAQTLTIPPQSSVAWATGAIIDVLVVGGVAPIIAAGVGVILHASQGTDLTGVYQARLFRARQDVWDLVLSPKQQFLTQLTVSNSGWNPRTDPPQGNTTPATALVMIGGKYNFDRLVSPNPGYYQWGLYSYLVNIGTGPMTAVNGRVRGNTAHAGGFTTRVYGVDPITHGIEIAMGAWPSSGTGDFVIGSPVITNIVMDENLDEGSRWESTMPMVASTYVDTGTTILSVAGPPGAPTSITMSKPALASGTDEDFSAMPAGTIEVIGALITSTSGTAEAETSVGIQFQAQSPESALYRGLSFGASALRSTGIGARFGLTSGDKGISFESTSFTNGLYFASAAFTGPAIRFNSVTATMLGEFKGSTTDAVLYLKQTGSGDVFRANDMSSDATPVLINASGMIVSGYATALTYNSSPNVGVQLSSTSSNRSGLALGQWANDAAGGQIIFAKSRSGTTGTQTIVQSGDALGIVRWEGSDGTAFIPAANIQCVVDGSPGTNDVPSRMVFRTSAVGAGTPGERLRITNDGTIQHSSAVRTVISASSHLTLRSYTVATLPSAATAAQMIYVSDGTSNKRMAVSDGTNWRWPDGAIVS